MKGDKTGVAFTDSEIGATNVYIVVFRGGICTVRGIMIYEFLHHKAGILVPF